MADNTKIEWTDATWNPITGCSVVSAGCRHCYAMKLAGTRLQHHPSRAGLTQDTSAGPVWNGQVRFNEQWLDQPLRWAKPRLIFVCAHGDLFHEAVPDEWLDRVFDVMMRSRQREWSETSGWSWAPGHTFQILTKRPARMRDYVLCYLAKRKAYADKFDQCPTEAMRNSPAAIAAREDAKALPSFIWLGVSVEDQAVADERIPLLLQTPAAVRWISAEPLLGPVDLRHLNKDKETNELDALHPWTWEQELELWRGSSETWEEDFEDWYGGMTVAQAKGPCHNKIDWVVVGGESGTNARPMHPAWARSLRDQCAAAGVPMLFKQWGEWAPSERHADAITMPGQNGDWFAWPGAMQDGWRDGPVSHRVGKKAAGRLLDGVQHDGYPVPPK